MKRKQEKRTENTNNATALLNTLNLTKDSLKKYFKEHNTGNHLNEFLLKG